jgi:hypothetical protein
MYHDMLSREYGKARQEKYLQEAQRCQHQAASEDDVPEKVEESAAPSMGVFLRFLRWIFGPSEVSSANGSP